MDKKEILDYLKNDDRKEELFTLADETRKKYVGDEVHLRGLINFSNICSKNCKYCGLRASNSNADRFRITKDEILELVDKASKANYKTIVLQSGEDMYFNTDRICEIVSEIKKYDVAVTLSIGEKTYEEYKAYKDAGADRYLLRIETTDENLYQEMHPNASFQNRVRCLRDLGELGYEVGTGCLVGLPNQTLESLANDILFFKEIKADMIGIGPFIAHQDTPLKDIPNGDYWLALKVMALTRILLKDINMPATTAMETIIPNGAKYALQSGANVFMPNLTLEKYREKYEIYPKKRFNDQDFIKTRTQAENLIKSIGRVVSKNKGFRKSNI